MSGGDKQSACLNRDKMVTKRIRSEYMKKFKDPKWETYTKCYEEMLAYRLTRRLLEHTHNPWFWNGSDSDSDSGGRSPSHPSKNQVEAGGGRAETEEPEGVKTDRQQETRTTGAGPRPTVQNEEQIRPDPQSSAHSSQCDDTREPNKAVQGEEEEFSAPLRDKEKETRAARPHQRKPSKSTRPAWRSQRVRPVRQLKEDTKEKRHPFALYGSGEKDADVADRKTHNVGPAASTAEVIFMNRLCVLRPGGRWSGRSSPGDLSGVGPNQRSQIKPGWRFSPSSTPGSPSTCAASPLAPDRTAAEHQHQQSHSCL
ncbi:centriole, cilia and spindle-associated protein isoform X3 [Gambusia affinis]|uniref:centriole, cilia and spindle-associated protein isoform X3 n=1 Tax=Gambusia affinis TaxID=33528 RepID=UPI001CDCA544|nr:centriole, cilia and spindle-associated protein isoform X3 [Gambusia affinis]